ncbi:acetylornithine deacetylase [Pararhizobium polonicum]|uniref:acetylornithine deacetylase n=1 Tax=Pararhizobium polonicum TaxID=1612624 RepID=UPI000A8C3DC8|nr:acetylornithine deacetylase [Pararhizobium polonicum]
MTVNPAIQERATGDVDTLLETAIAVLDKLVSFPSISSVSNRDVVDYICEYLSGFGATIERLPSPEQEKDNLWISFGEGSEGGLVLSGHIDVVPVTGQEWTRPPFSLTREGGKVYGRGTTDMKGFVACAMAAATLFQHGSLRHPVHLAITFDEEVGCLGARELVEFLKQRGIRPAAIFVGEPTSMAVVDRHKGSVGFTTEIVGKAAHSSQVHLGQSAIQIAGELIGALTSLGAHQATKQADEAFPYAYPSINVGAITGGQVRNIVAANCAFDWEIRPILPGQLVDIRQAFECHVSEKLETYRASGHLVPSIVTRLVYDTPPLVGDPQSQATALAMKFAGQNRALAVSYGTEAGIYQEAGFVTVVCGPGDIQQAHAPDEWIEIDQLHRCLDFMERLADYARETGQ